MPTNYLDIKSVTGSDSKLVRQNLKFRTGRFVWKVCFNIPLNPATVNSTNLMVFNSQNKQIDTFISYNSEAHVIEIEPKEAYSAGEAYTLHVTKRVESKGGQHLKNEIDVQFVV